MKGRNITLSQIEKFGKIEYVFDKYSKNWTWKVTGPRAIMMISKLIPESWCGEGPNEAIVPDTKENFRHILWISQRYPLEILSKSVWQKKAAVTRINDPEKKKAQKSRKPEKLKRVTPAKLFRGKLLNFQKHGLDFLLKSSGNALLADEMGLGKTVQTLAYVATESQSYPVLVVAPLVTLTNWHREIEKFLRKGKDEVNYYHHHYSNGNNGNGGNKKPVISKKAKAGGGNNGDGFDDDNSAVDGNVFYYGSNGSGDEPSIAVIRSGKRAPLPKADFYITNYEMVYKRVDDLLKLGIKTIVCDEVQNLRSKTTKKYTAIRRLANSRSVQYRIGLSGTPIYNRGSEIWPIVDILKPGLLGTFKEFCDYFCWLNEKGKAIVLESKREDLRNELQKHVMLRRTKSDVLKELKDKVRYSEIIDADTDYYLAELDKIWKNFKREQKKAKSEFDKKASYQRAIQSERQAAGFAKLPHVINFVKNIMEIEESVIVFCHHRAIHDFLHESLGEFSPASIIGGQSDSQRQAQIDSFHTGKTKLMIAGLRAGNVGINLSNARYVIFAELDWSPAIHRQAEDRLHRIGQKNSVFAYYLIGKGTLDEHVGRVLVDKKSEIDAIMGEEDDDSENKEKAELILAQIHDKLATK